MVFHAQAYFVARERVATEIAEACRKEKEKLELDHNAELASLKQQMSVQNRASKEVVKRRLRSRDKLLRVEVYRSRVASKEVGRMKAEVETAMHYKDAWEKTRSVMEERNKKCIEKGRSLEGEVKRLQEIAKKRGRSIAGLQIQVAQAGMTNGRLRNFVRIFEGECKDLKETLQLKDDIRVRLEFEASKSASAVEEVRHKAAAFEQERRELERTIEQRDTTIARLQLEAERNAAQAAMDKAASSLEAQNLKLELESEVRKNQKLAEGKKAWQSEKQALAKKADDLETQIVVLGKAGGKKAKAGRAEVVELETALGKAQRGSKKLVKKIVSLEHELVSSVAKGNRADRALASITLQVDASSYPLPLEREEPPMAPEPWVAEVEALAKMFEGLRVKEETQEEELLLCKAQLRSLRTEQRQTLAAQTAQWISHQEQMAELKVKGKKASTPPTAVGGVLAFSQEKHMPTAGPETMEVEVVEPSPSIPSNTTTVPSVAASAGAPAQVGVPSNVLDTRMDVDAEPSAQPSGGTAATEAKKQQPAPEIRRTVEQSQVHMDIDKHPGPGGDQGKSGPPAGAGPAAPVSEESTKSQMEWKSQHQDSADQNESSDVKMVDAVAKTATQGQGAGQPSAPSGPFSTSGSASTGVFPPNSPYWGRPGFSTSAPATSLPGTSVDPESSSRAASAPAPSAPVASVPAASAPAPPATAAPALPAPALPAPALPAPALPAPALPAPATPASVPAASAPAASSPAASAIPASASRTGDQSGGNSTAEGSNRKDTPSVAPGSMPTAAGPARKILTPSHKRLTAQQRDSLKAKEFFGKLGPVAKPTPKPEPEPETETTKMELEPAGRKLAPLKKRATAKEKLGKLKETEQVVFTTPMKDAQKYMEDVASKVDLPSDDDDWGDE